MSATECTKLYIIMVTVLSLSWTVYMQQRYGAEATISGVMQEWSTTSPLTVGFVFAVLAHWYWPVR